ncbi:MAG: prepilin-type N-terminal cleavage/methylation domain-containing protein [Clostridium sulfidigenes]|uniref:Prepilin-type N-terminal cleavage/methylation domain-containing protein n=1 Tax=Clostridium sulfidigenes TaxID=318464 RepID=A0A927WCA9_9CLOT|nr:prepilin-type N-terminal cleavage/methylation domain-containing protein [Clostridium sulfidigenes]
MILNRKKKGVTLIELVIALGLLAIVTSFIFSFFFSNERKLEEINTRSDLQYEAKVILDSISKHAMAATKCKVDKELDGTVKTITFSKVEDDGTVTDEGAEFIIEENNVYISTKEDGKRLIGSHLHHIEISDDILKSIEIRLSLKEEDIDYSVKESFLFRNRHKN